MPPSDEVRDSDSGSSGRMRASPRTPGGPEALDVGDFSDHSGSGREDADQPETATPMFRVGRMALTVPSTGSTARRPGGLSPQPAIAIDDFGSGAFFLFLFLKKNMKARRRKKGTRRRT